MVSFLHHLLLVPLVFLVTGTLLFHALLLLLIYLVWLKIVPQLKHVIGFLPPPSSLGFFGCGQSLAPCPSSPINLFSCVKILPQLKQVIGFLPSPPSLGFLGYGHSFIPCPSSPINLFSYVKNRTAIKACHWLSSTAIFSWFSWLWALFRHMSLFTTIKTFFRTSRLLLLIWTIS